MTLEFGGTGAPVSGEFDFIAKIASMQTAATSGSADAKDAEPVGG
ncbi:hypothetical protein [Mycobacterium colombiense]|nr:hypothetical protein [Mycobacterium colombiense]